MHDQNRAVYVISVAAELAGVHPQTLRIYERKGLVAPARTGGGSRRYSRSDIDQLLRIQELTNEGLNLLGVQRVLQLENDLANARAELETQRQESLRKIEALRQEAEGHLRAQRRDLVPLRQEVVLYRDVRPGSTRRLSQPRSPWAQAGEVLSVGATTHTRNRDRTQRPSGGRARWPSQGVGRYQHLKIGSSSSRYGRGFDPDFMAIRASVEPPLMTYEDRLTGPVNCSPWFRYRSP